MAQVTEFNMEQVWLSEVDRAELVGRRAVFTTFEGEELVGTIEADLTTLRFADGRWGRLDDVVRFVD